MYDTLRFDVGGRGRWRTPQRLGEKLSQFCFRPVDFGVDFLEHSVVSDHLFGQRSNGIGEVGNCWKEARVFGVIGG